MKRVGRVQVAVGLDELDDDEVIRARAAKAARVPEADLPELRIVRKSIDARGRHVRFQLLLEPFPEEEEPPLGGPLPREVAGDPVIVVGDGPAGLFCAYALAREGIAVTVIDRGKQVQPRRRDLALLNREGKVDPDSNYCFGEGGAGTYSDGKLYTRADKRGPVRDVMEILALHGAPGQILTDARPHIGSNKLPKVIGAMRDRLIECGVTFRFESRVVGLVRTGGRVTGVRLEGGEELGGSHVVLATGHSARDVLRFLDDAGMRLEPKPFALGVRIEHPQPLINSIQYGRDAGHPRLPAASYRLAHTEDERGVFSFCMCPGGWIVPAATEPGGLVVNGMSLSKRGSPYANSGFVVSVDPADWEGAGFTGPLGGLAFQDAIERAAFTAGGGALRAPATRVTDFMARRASTTVPEGSYRPGFLAGDVAEVLDVTGVPLAEPMRRALRVFGKRMRGYVTADAVLVGVESRTSCPVRIPRDDESLESPDLPGLYPTGEGAGYAGGIVSAALDGMRVADAIVSVRR
ncbi:MAG: FAD-binding protein [Sandaracinus sp.]|nr:FAD-binding protein [Sandaracinus sp.]|tara:strand:- start:470 stop:2032 length:1563 start_codon:yes stop_codon:yes gene_type:complete